jgi:translation initiation factor 1
MTDSNSRLVYSTESGRIDEPKAKVERPKGTVSCASSVRPVDEKGKGFALSPELTWMMLN